MDNVVIRTSEILHNVVLPDMVFVILVTDAFQRQRRTNTVDAVVTDERAAFFRGVKLAEMLGEFD